MVGKKEMLGKTLTYAICGLNPTSGVIVAVDPTDCSCPYGIIYRNSGEPTSQKSEKIYLDATIGEADLEWPMDMWITDIR